MWQMAMILSPRGLVKWYGCLLLEFDSWMKSLSCVPAQFGLLILVSDSVRVHGQFLLEHGQFPGVVFTQQFFFKKTLGGRNATYSWQVLRYQTLTNLSEKDHASSTRVLCYRSLSQRTILHDPPLYKRDMGFLRGWKRLGETIYPFFIILLFEMRLGQKFWYFYHMRWIVGDDKLINFMSNLWISNIILDRWSTFFSMDIADTISIMNFLLLDQSRWNSEMVTRFFGDILGQWVFSITLLVHPTADLRV